MKHNWEEFKDKVMELKTLFSKKNEGMETDVEVLIPGEEGYESEVGVPYVRVRYYTDDHVHERRIDLYEYHLKRDFKELVNLIEHFIQEFEMEIDQSEYGGG